MKERVEDGSEGPAIPTGGREGPAIPPTGVQVVHQLEDEDGAGLLAGQAGVQGRIGGAGGGARLPRPLQHQAQMAHNLVPENARRWSERAIVKYFLV